MVLYCTRVNFTKLYMGVQYTQKKSTYKNFTALHCTDLHYNEPPCTALQSSELKVTALHCTALHYTLPVFPGGLDLMNTSRISDLLGQEGPKTVFIGPV